MVHVLKMMRKQSNSTIAWLMWKVRCEVSVACAGAGHGRGRVEGRQLFPPSSVLAAAVASRDQSVGTSRAAECHSAMAF